MQKKFFIIGLVIALITPLFYTGLAAAEEEAPAAVPVPLIIQACQADAEWNWKFIEMPTIDKEFTDLDFRKEFERARTKYHDAVKCVFEKATEKILDSAGKKRIQDLNTPKKACIEQNIMVALLTDTGPQQLMKPLLDLYNDKKTGYAKYLNDLLKDYKARGANSSPDFSKLIEHANFFDLLVENEIQDSLVALDQAFQTLKEMRSAFVMHVHFQCMLLNLEDFRRVISNLRKAVGTILPVFEDCGISKK